MRSKRSTAPDKFIDYDFIPQDTSKEEATNSEEDEIMNAINKGVSSDEDLLDTTLSECSEKEEDPEHNDISPTESSKSEKPDRHFSILTDSVVPEDDTPPFVYDSPSQDLVDHSNIELKSTETFYGKTPMQAAKSALLFIVSKSISEKSVYIFTIQECNDAGKIYSYRGISENGALISIKAHKRDLIATKISKKSKKSKIKIKNELLIEEQYIEPDGFIVERKIIPPRAKDITETKIVKHRKRKIVRK